MNFLYGLIRPALTAKVPWWRVPTAEAVLLLVRIEVWRREAGEGGRSVSAVVLLLV